MTSHKARQAALLSLLLILCLSPLHAQFYRYITFPVDQFQESPVRNAGKQIKSLRQWYFGITNQTHQAVAGVTFVASPLFPVVKQNSWESFTVGAYFESRSGLFNGANTWSGSRSTPFLPPDYTIYCRLIDSVKNPVLQEISYQWMTSGVDYIGERQVVQLPAAAPVYVQPNASNLAEYVFKKIVPSTGIVLGKPNAQKSGLWLRLTKFKPRMVTSHGHIGRLLARRKIGERRNDVTLLQQNYLATQLFSLKLSIELDRQGVVEGTGNNPAPFADLVFNEPGPINVRIWDPADSTIHYDVTGFPLLNGKTIDEIAGIADNMLTNGAASVADYYQVSMGLDEILHAYGNEFYASSFSPMKIQVTPYNFLRDYLRPATATIVHHQRLEPSASAAAPLSFQLRHNYPNPFNPETKISFTLAGQSRVSLIVYNLVGQEVAVLARNVDMETGEHTVTFTGANLPSGIYLYKLTAQSMDEAARHFEDTGRMALIR